MDWKAEIEAAVQAGVKAAFERYASVEEPMDEMARRRRRYIELAEDTMKRDPVWAEKVARRRAAFATSSTSPASASILTACASRDVNLATRSPATCSTNCPSHDTASSVSSVTLTSSTTTIDIVPMLAGAVISGEALDINNMGCAAPTTVVCLLGGSDDRSDGEDLVAMSATLHKPENADTSGKHEDQQLLACSSVERPLAPVAAWEVTGDHCFVTGAFAMPLTLVALDVHDGNITNEHMLQAIASSAASPIQLQYCCEHLGMCLHPELEFYMCVPSPWDPGRQTNKVGNLIMNRNSVPLVLWPSRPPDRAKLSGIIPSLLLPMDVSQMQSNLFQKESPCYLQAGTSFALEMVSDNDQLGSKFVQWEIAWTISLAPGSAWFLSCCADMPQDAQGQPLYDMGTKLLALEHRLLLMLTTASGLACLQGNSVHEPFYCSVEVDTITKCMMALAELQPWVSWESTFLVLTVYLGTWNVELADSVLVEHVVNHDDLYLQAFSSVIARPLSTTLTAAATVQDTTVALESNLTTATPITCSTACSEGDTSPAVSQVFMQATLVIIHGEFVPGNKLLRLPWNTADPCSHQGSLCNPMELEMHALFIPACGSTTLQGSLVHHVYARCSCGILQYPLSANLELCHPWRFPDGAQPCGMIPVFQFVDESSCSFLFEQQLEPWPSWEIFLWVTVYHQPPPAKPPDKSNYISANQRVKIQWSIHIVDCVWSCNWLEHSAIKFEFKFNGQKGQYSYCIILMSEGAIQFGPEYFAWEIAWFLVGTCHACSDFGGSVHGISKHKLFGHWEKLISILSIQSPFCCAAVQSTRDTSKFPPAGFLLPCLPAATEPDSNGTYGILTDLHSRLGLMLLGVLVVCTHLTLIKITQLHCKGLNYWKYPMPSAYQVMLRRYKSFSTWSTFRLELLHNTLLQDWIHSGLIRHNIQCPFEILPWPAFQLHLSVLAQMECFCELPFCTSWADRMVLKDDGLELDLMPPVSSDLMYLGDSAQCCSQILQWQIAWSLYPTPLQTWFSYCTPGKVALYISEQLQGHIQQPEIGNIQLLTVKLSYSVTASSLCIAGLFTWGHSFGICHYRIVSTEYSKLVPIAWDFRGRLLPSNGYDAAKDHRKASLSIPWDPGGAAWWRLEGKPPSKEGGMLATLLPARWAATDGPGPARKTDEDGTIIYQQDDYRRTRPGTGWLRPPLLLSLHRPPLVPLSL